LYPASLIGVVRNFFSLPFCPFSSPLENKNPGLIIEKKFFFVTSYEELCGSEQPIIRETEREKE
jgi:hypothetical protein